MKLPLTFLSRSRRSVGRGKIGGARRGRSGFTLIEILTSITVMTIMIALLGAMILTMGQTWRNAQEQVNNFTKARSMLDMFDHDLQAGLFRPDLTAFSGGNIQFYTLRPGISTTQPVRSISAVTYQINSTSNILQRSDQSYQWGDAIPFGSGTAFPTSGTARNTAAGMIDFKVLFVQEDGTLSSTYSSSVANPTRAVGITLAVVDDQTMLVLTGTQVTALRTALDGAITQTRSVKTDWESYLNGASMNWKNYPTSLGVGLKVFERYVILPNAT
jgi:prepilin-type N-terminal cleavage/methylation domain-containing protein